MNNKVTLRTAQKEDLPAIYDLVYELAVYEKEPHALTASIEDYYQDFEQGIFHAEVAEAEGQIIGMTLYYLTFSTWKGRMLYLEDFVVTESWRGKGIGKLLLDNLIRVAKKRACVLMKWQVLDWNEPAIQFYKKYDTAFEDQWLTVKLPL